ncbi:MAG: NADH-quinone oxidoreductase subunit NuoF [candidate division Zixibacteria bacterium]|nr:NADH-quinone oxidoreductase subunit NuoF [candidate division Zixibacteria bacterium]
MAEYKLLFRNIDEPDQHTVKGYESRRGYIAWRKALTSMKPDEVIAEVKTSGLRGRGGAGFPTGVKWSFVPKDSPKPRYLICNADESEPGTCKDRVLLERDPHAMIEGMAIGSFAIGSHLAFVYIRGEFDYSIAIVEKAVEDAYKAGHLGKNIYGTGYDLEMIVYTGGGAYICGEETALINSLAGERGMSSMRPPFPAIEGLYGCPTIVNNVETLACVPHIINRGGEWHKKIGTEKSPGTKLFSLTGHVNRPGNYEVELGTPLSYLINELGGGIKDGNKLKAVIPGGASCPFLSADQVDTPLDFEAMAEAGSMLGSGAVIVMDERTDIAWVTYKLIKFFKHESCGKCTPCREGTKWLTMMIERILRGDGKEGDLDKIADVCDNILGRTICPLGDAAVMPIISVLQKFRGDFEKHIKGKKKIEMEQFSFA